MKIKFKKNLLIGIDRDGTINYDDNYYLGSQRDWKSLVKILPKVVNGVKLLNLTFPKAKIYILTNQPAVAVKEFPLLTQKKAEIVCKFIIKELNKKQAKIHGCEVCGHASKSYLKRKKGKFTFYKKYTCECSCMKPKTGLFLTALKREGFNLNNTSLYMIGDRITDVKAGHNAGGIGIYVPFKNTMEDEDKLNRLNFKYFKAKDFLDAVKFIIGREK